jgi:hypothetical protein
VLILSLCLSLTCISYRVTFHQDKKYGFGGAERKKAKLNDKK